MAMYVNSQDAFSNSLNSNVLPENHKLKDKINKSLRQKAESLKKDFFSKVYMNVLLYVRLVLISLNENVCHC